MGFEHSLGRVTLRWGARFVWGFSLLSACSTDSGTAADSSLAICATGQVTGCKCADGAAPNGQTGCSVPSVVTPAMNVGAAGKVASTMSGVAGVAATATAASMKAAGAAGMLAAMSSAAPAAGTSSTSPTNVGMAGAPAAGSGAAGGGAAGKGAAGGAANAAGAPAAASGEANSAAMACGSGGMTGKASNAGGAQGRGNGNVQYQVSASNQIVRMQTTLLVPAKPNGNTTLFLWPGLEPIQGSPHYSPIGTGVLQPVLTWGGSCAPGSIQTSQGNNWWISAQYVNTLGNEMNHKGCHGGNVMNVENGDLLDVDMSLKGTIWNQKITNRKTGKSVDFDMDMNMQEQRWAMFEIEMASQSSPSEDTVFTSTVITFDKAEAKACQPTTRGADDYFSAPVASADGLRCCTDRIVLRVAGAKHTTMDP